MGSGKSTQLACKKAGISEQSYYRWRKQYGGLQHDHAKRFKELDCENACLKKLVAELSLKKAMLKEVARETGKPRVTPSSSMHTAGAHCRFTALCLSCGGAAARRAALCADGARR